MTPENKALDAVYGVHHRVLTVSGSARNMKVNELWLPRYLQPTEGGYIPLNNRGFLLGLTGKAKIRPEWIIPADAVEIPNDLVDADGWVDLYRGELPWSDESAKKSYLGRLRQVFKIPMSAVHAARPSVNPGVRFGI